MNGCLLTYCEANEEVTRHICLLLPGQLAVMPGEMNNQKINMQISLCAFTVLFYTAISNILHLFDPLSSFIDICCESRHL